MTNVPLIIELLSQNGYYILNKTITKALGLDNAFMLSYLIDKSRFHNNQEFYCNIDLIIAETCFDRRNTLKILQWLETNNLIIVKRKGLPRRNFYTINFDKIQDIILKNRTTCSSKIDTNSSSSSATTGSSKSATTYSIKNKEVITNSNNKEREGSSPPPPPTTATTECSSDSSYSSSIKSKDNTEKPTTPQTTPTIPKNKKRGGLFTPPSLAQISEYCKERANHIDPQSFYDFYQSKDWMVGKNKMADWQASIRTWERREQVQEKGGVPTHRTQTPYRIRSQAEIVAEFNSREVL